MDRAVVDDFVERVRLVAGDERAFATLFQAIDRDPRVRQPEAAALALAVAGRLPPGSSRREALRRLWSHHRRVVDQSILDRRNAA